MKVVDLNFQLHFLPQTPIFPKITIPSIGVMEFQPDISQGNDIKGSGFWKDPGIPTLFLPDLRGHRIGSVCSCFRVCVCLSVCAVLCEDVAGQYLG